MRQDNGPENLLYSLSVLRPGEAKRRFRKSIFEDYPLRGPFNHCACAYCGRWNEKLTIDHIVPKSKGGPHFAKWNSAPSCLSCNAAKSNLPLFEWWRPQQFWSQEREDALMAWIYAHSFVSAHTAIGEWEEWMHETQRIVPIHEVHEKAARVWPLSLQLGLAS
jgi:hypothetical protein